MDEQAHTDAAPVAERALHSDPHDFAGLYVRHRSSFTLHARRYLRDQRDADEVVQEAFLRLFLALPELQTELQALAYCRRTITNLCIDRFRAQARRPHLVGLDSAPLDALADDDPGDPVVRAEDAALVRAALSLLTPLHRAALVKREIEEKPLPVIAAELEVPEESVKHLLFRARRALRRILSESSLAPGGDGELSAALAKAVSKGGLAVLALVLATIGLGTGPDLRVIPVVGSDLPDLPSIAQLATRLGQSLTGTPADSPFAQAPVAPVGPVAPQPPESDGGPLLPAASPSESPGPGAAAAAPVAPEPVASPATATSGIDPRTTPVPGPLPAPVPSASAGAPSPQPSPTGSPGRPGGPSPAPSAGPAGTASPVPAGPAPTRAAPASAAPTGTTGSTTPGPGAGASTSATEVSARPGAFVVSGTATG